LKIYGIASGFAFGYDPTRRSVFFTESIIFLESSIRLFSPENSKRYKRGVSSKKERRMRKSGALCLMSALFDERFACGAALQASKGASLNE